ncbi:hypothetical protein BN874_1630009 [Candidatus Contendobacter odensis Run_B_J11]|uniref:Uncharacterized protein n=1 Tax=Candidatus Contendobacter odensis Run_B_J11 TaxID=1400861 RepID=A0A7U7J202_9GAMM|nr:hypothetical protein BN874_1630009 [Candidatus Contendobacter odensis Run_B_J11]
MPVVALVNRAGLLKGQVRYIHVRIAALTDAVSGQSARVLAVIAQSAFFGQDDFQAFGKGAHRLRSVALIRWTG